LSHRDAAGLWDLRSSERSAVDVTVLGRGRRRRPGIDIHVTRTLHPDDRTIVDSIPVTSVPRTLLDLVDVLEAKAVQRAYERAARLRLLDVRAIEALLERSNGRRGVAVLRELLDYDPAPAAGTKSELELMFLDLIRAAGLPTPQVNVLVEGFEVDAHWPRAGLVVELDSYEHHADRRAFERDRVKIRELRLAGYEVLPVTYRQLEHDPGRVIAAVRAMLARNTPIPNV
jgi:very-short-patch-repair endonuclease